MITGNKLVGEIASELIEISLPNMASALQTIYRGIGFTDDLSL